MRIVYILPLPPLVKDRLVAVAVDGHNSRMLQLQLQL
jgi:hypothetical protein